MLTGCASGEENRNSLDRLYLAPWNRCVARSVWDLAAGAGARLCHVLHPTKKWALHAVLRGACSLLQSIIWVGGTTEPVFLS